MAIFPQTAALILKEHKHRPITGRVVLIGRQTVLMDEAAATELMAREGVPLRDGYSRERDTSTVASTGQLSDRAFFSMFSDATVVALDVSDYEGAEIVQDLNEPLADQHKGIADFIFNGSCLDNLFDPASAIKSMSKMLRPGGRVVHIEHGTPRNGAFVCYSPEWFFDYYAINNYRDCRTYLCAYGNMSHPWVIYRWLPYDAAGIPSPPDPVATDFLNFVVAEKGAQATDERTPIQGHYRDYQGDPSEDIYVRKHREFAALGDPFAFPSHPRTPWRHQLIGALNRYGYTLEKGGPLRFKIVALPARKGTLRPLGTQA